MLGKSLSCLTIISPDSFRWADGTKYNEGNTLISKVGFAGIEVEVEKGTKLKDYQPLKGFKEKKFPIPVYNITGRKFSERYTHKCGNEEQNQLSCQSSSYLYKCEWDGLQDSSGS